MTARHLLMAGLLLLSMPAIAQDAAAPDYAEMSLSDPAKEDKALAVMDSIRCVVCQGQPVSGSNAELAADMRRIIREHIAAGESPDEVRRWLISRYGDWISLKPQVKPITMPLWLVPLAALAGGLWLVSRRLRRHRSAG